MSSKKRPWEYSPEQAKEVRKKAFEKFGRSHTQEQFDREIVELVGRQEILRYDMKTKQEAKEKGSEMLNEGSEMELMNVDTPNRTTDEINPGVKDSLFESQNSQEPVKEYTLPKWYTEININGYQMKQVTKSTKDNAPNRQAITSLTALKDCIQLCEVESNKQKLAEHFEELRNHIHKAEFMTVNKYVLRKVFMLDNGLTRIFAPKQPTKNEFPWDLKADARQLYHRWYNEIFSVDLLRGIVLARAKNKADKRNADRIDPEWPHRVSAKYYGHGDLVMGQWWPTQLCTMRDGAHGSAQGGISGDKGKGAYSIVLSGGHNYSDEDSGEDIWYAGTEGKDFLPTENTLRMIESCDVIKEPVRVIRSHNLDKSNPYRPKGGFRYDGLYDVVAKEVLDEEKAMYRFRLIRRGGQDPIRYEDNATRRPTQNELAEYEKLSSEREVVMID